MKRILYAFRFLTILPIPWKQDEDLTVVARSMIYFPFVGLTLGALLLGLSYILNPFLSELTTASVIVTTWILLTGGLHLDGLSDLFDGFGGRDKKQRLEIMKDSNIGAFGALALIIIILLKVVLVREVLINSPGTYNILLITPVWGRLIQLITIRFYPCARQDGMGSFFKKVIRMQEWLVPLFLTIVLTIYLFSFWVLIPLLIFITTIILFSNSISKMLGGLTGDCYGAICEISEVLFLLLLIIYGQII